MQLILADSNELIRIGLRAALSTQREIQIVGEAKNSEELIDLINSFPAGLVMIDFTAPGFELGVVAKAIKIKKDIKFIAITAEQGAQTLVDALRNGIMSYVKKDCDLAEITDAVLETHRGNKFFCGQILETIQSANLDVDDLDFNSFTCDSVILTERENEIIKLIAEGFTNEQIAEMLFISKHTVNTHRKNILAKLGVKNTAGIVMFAVKTNLVSPNKFLFAPN